MADFPDSGRPNGIMVNERRDPSSSLTSNNNFESVASGASAAIPCPRVNDGVAPKETVRPVSVSNAQLACNDFLTRASWPPPLPEGSWILERAKEEARAASSQRTEDRAKRSHPAEETTEAVQGNAARGRSGVDAADEFRSDRASHYPALYIDRYRPRYARRNRYRPSGTREPKRKKLVSSKEDSKVHGTAGLQKPSEGSKDVQAFPQDFSIAPYTMPMAQDERRDLQSAQATPSHSQAEKRFRTPSLPTVNIRGRSLYPPRRPSQAMATLPYSDRYRPTYNNLETGMALPGRTQRRTPSEVKPKKECQEFKEYTVPVRPEMHSGSRFPNNNCRRGRGNPTCPSARFPVNEENHAGDKTYDNRFFEYLAQGESTTLFHYQEEEV